MRWRALLRRAWAPAIVAVVIIGGWELAVHVFDIQPLILPAPSDIVQAFRDDWTAIASATRRTLAEVVLGLIVGVIFGVVMATVDTDSTLGALHIGASSRRAGGPRRREIRG